MYLLRTQLQNMMSKEMCIKLVDLSKEEMNRLASADPHASAAASADVYQHKVEHLIGTDNCFKFVLVSLIYN